MVAPVMRRLTRALPTALGVYALAVDQETGLTFIRVSNNNAIIDVLSSLQPPEGSQYEIRVLKNGIDTGRRLYSEQLDPSSAGRFRFQANLTPGDYSFSVAQTAGTLATYSFCVVFANPP